MASKAITGFGSERTEAKRPIGNVAIDGIATRRWQAQAFGPTTASAKSTYLEAPQPPSALIHHHHHLLHLPFLHQRHHLSLRPICLQIKKQTFNPQNTHKKS